MTSIPHHAAARLITMKTRNEVQIYTFASGEDAHAIRVLMRDGEPWFVAADICRALDIGRTDDGVSRLDDDEKGADSIRTPGGEQAMTVVSQSGLYSLVLGSRKPEAKPFKRWITHEVLPAIARTGVYIDADNRMGDALGDATNEALRVEAVHNSDLSIALRHIASVMMGLTARIDDIDTTQEEREAKRIEELARIQRDHAQQLRAMRQELSRSIGKAVRIAKAQRASNKNADPNRPLSDDDVERFKYLLGTGATAKQIARSLNRTYEVIRRFMDTNQDLVIRTLQHSLL